MGGLEEVWEDRRRCGRTGGGVVSDVSHTTHTPHTGQLCLLQLLWQ